MAPQAILDLVRRFKENKDAYCSPSYNETQLRQEFLNPFFEALGWDIANKQGHAEAYKEVIHEDAVKIGTATKAPDYSFRVGGTRKFFVEAKKPFVNIKEDISPAFQLRRYAWSATLPLSILSDFEEFAVYDCRVKPAKNDGAAVGRVLYINYEEYEKRWDDIASVFSKDAVLKGSFDRFAETNRAKKGTTEVDDAFLSEIEGWRDLLARNIAIRNEKLSNRELNFAVQRTIDRVIFLRICEDRGIEDYGRLQAHLNGENIYKRLCVLFREADDKYNSGLFHFHEEKGRDEEPDNITLKLDIDDKVLKEIIEKLYYPESAYEFSVLPADILGQVYEQFLGKVIRLTAGHQAKVEDKPEVKKAGGVFYTPTYIVDYIVKNTVGALLENKTPKQAAELRILDPACGSGSFLIGAYQFLLDWHHDWYCKNNPEKWATGKNPTLYKARQGEYRLTTPERKKILLNNIYGVDIDTQAVEVTKLSLLLKVLEGENDQSISQQLKLFHQRALPDLGNNIKCGNSLIGSDFFQYEGVQETMPLYGGRESAEDEERYKVNAFDWNKEQGFQEIMKCGGFDAVIGNPPYGAAFSDKEKNYLQTTFSTMVGKYDSYGFFIEKGLNILRERGNLGFITPHTWLTVTEAESLRKLIVQKALIKEIVRLPDRVFKTATVNTILVFFQKGIIKSDKKSVRVLLYPRTENITNISPKNVVVTYHSQSAWQKSSGVRYNIEIDSKESIILNKINSRKQVFSDICDFCVGVQAYDRCTGQSQDIIKERSYHSRTRRDSTFKKELNGNDVSRYWYYWPQGNWISYGEWLAHPRKPYFFKGPRILVREITGSGKHIVHSTFVDEEYVNYKTILNILLNKDAKEEGWNDLCLLGILNSSLISWYFLRVSNKLVTHTFPRISILDIKKFPVPDISFCSPSDKFNHDRLVSLVTNILDLHKKLLTGKTEHEKTVLSRQIESTDHRIDELVYDLYGLTKEEIEIVESSLEKKE
jgi:type I restriction-modification system DNA methylase subunit/predicted type IV restriction endonuclease